MRQALARTPYLRQPAMPNVARQQVADGASTPAPTGGWDAVSALANMDEDRAIVLDNWFPRPDSVEVRRGYKNHATGMGSTDMALALATLRGGKHVYVEKPIAVALEEAFIECREMDASLAESLAMAALACSVLRSSAGEWSISQHSPLPYWPHCCRKRR